MFTTLIVNSGKITAGLKGGGAIGFVCGSVCYMLKDYKNQGIKGENGIRKYIIDSKYALNGYDIGSTVGLVIAAYYI